jgi:hypothetical protein
MLKIFTRRFSEHDFPMPMHTMRTTPFNTFEKTQSAENLHFFSKINFMDAILRFLPIFDEVVLKIRPANVKTDWRR